MNAIRSFIAIELNQQVQQNLATVIARLKSPSANAVRWTTVQNIHLTLKFLGDVSPANMDHLKKMLQAQVSQQPRFSFQVSGIGAFPNLRRPRVIWAGVIAPLKLDTLARLVEVETTRLGYPLEERPFSPHLTLGRVAQNATPEDVRRAADALTGISVDDLGAVDVREVTLFRSDLDPRGSIYTPLLKIPLRI
jgi:RNA 2',3'-cyclic 3'-phosphodiesterase